MARQPRCAAPSEPRKVSDGPTWGYRRQGDAVEARIFEDGCLPEGWQDTPAALEG